MLLDYLRQGSETLPTASTRAPILLTVGFGLHFLAVMCVGARVLVRLKLGRFGREDVLIVISTIITFSLLLTTAIMSQFGFGMHTSDMKAEWGPIYSKYIYGTCIIGSIPFALNKLSMLCFYLRLAPHPGFRIICRLCITYVSLLYTIFSFINTFGCSPISAGWTHDMSVHATCITNTYFYYTMSLNNTFSDILLLVLPIPILLQLQVRTKVKIGLVAMFTMGFMVTGVSLFFLWTQHQSINSKDNVWDAGYCWTVALIECNVAIMTASMPGVFVFIRWVRGDELEHPVIGKPGVESDCETIGGRGGPPRRCESTLTTDGIGSVVSQDGSEQYELGGLPEIPR